MRDNIDGCPEALRLMELAIEGYQPSRHFNEPWTQPVHDRFREFHRRLLTFTPTLTNQREIGFGASVYDNGLHGHDASLSRLQAGVPSNSIVTDITPNPRHGIRIESYLYRYGNCPGRRIGYGFSTGEGLMAVVYLHKRGVFPLIVSSFLRVLVMT